MWENWTAMRDHKLNIIDCSWINSFTLELRWSNRPLEIAPLHICLIPSGVRGWIFVYYQNFHSTRAHHEHVTPALPALIQLKTSSCKILKTINNGESDWVLGERKLLATFVQHIMLNSPQNWIDPRANTEPQNQMSRPTVETIDKRPDYMPHICLTSIILLQTANMCCQTSTSCHHQGTSCN